MKQYTIPNTDLRVSRLAYGTWHLGGEWDKTPPSDDVKQQAVRLIAAAVDSGINHIDLADIYTLGKSDEVVGHALRQDKSLRDQIVLQGKCGIVVGADPDFGPPQRYDFSCDHIVQSVETTLKRLGTDRLDLLALHRPDPLVEYEEVARAFDQLHAGGKVRYFGVSNHTAGQIALLQRHVRQPIVLNQLELSLLHHSLISEGILANMAGYDYCNNAGLLDFCRLHEIMIQAWSPTARGKVFAEHADATAAEKRLAKTIAAFAQQYDTTDDAIALAWLLRHPAGMQPILGTKNVDRISKSAGADDVSLSRRDWFTLLEAARGAPVP
jgi:predicted oxidoreductase